MPILNFNGKKSGRALDTGLLLLKPTPVTYTFNHYGLIINNQWDAQFKTENIDRIVDEKAHQLVVPMLRNHPKIEKPITFRCYVWLKVANKNERICVLMDIDIEDIKTLIRPPEKGLHNIIFIFLECTNVVNLNSYDENVEN